MSDLLNIGGKELASRLFVGTGKFARKSLVREVLERSGAEVVTVALRRVDADSEDENILDHIPERCILMPNTSGARNAEEAVRIARLARAAGCGSWIKVEVIADNKYLLPDNTETLKTVEILAGEGFTVLPYMNPDLTAARRMQDAGAAAIMPLGAPIGTNRGLRTRELVEILVEEIALPVIVDAGIGSPSEAAECMELGCAAVLVNTALAASEDPVSMAEAFSLAVKAGRLAYLAGKGPKTKEAEASSPLTGFLRG
ncbi:MAG: thiazole synthase [Candidatus Omnitrophica bacterium]|nr:thiazole synthase [Candidatus Omnitrophota bacterium]